MNFKCLLSDEPPSRKRRRARINYGYESSEDEAPKSKYSKKIELLRQKGLEEDFRTMECLRQKVRRALETPEQRRRSNALARKRMRRKRIRDAERQAEKKQTRSSKLEDEQRKEQQKAYWRKKKQESRKRLREQSSQIEEKEDKRARNEVKPLSPLSSSTPTKSILCGSFSTPQQGVEKSTVMLRRCSSAPASTATLDPDSRSAQAKRHARRRMLNGISPRSPRKFVHTYLSIYEKCSPRKKKMLKEIFPSPTSSKVNHDIVSAVRRKNEADSRKLDKASLKKKLCFVKIAREVGDKARNALGLEWSRMYRKLDPQGKVDSDVSDDEMLQRKQRSDAISQGKVDEIKKFLNENSTVIGNVKSVKKDLKERRVLQASMAALYEKYKKTTTTPVGLTAFKRQRGEFLLPDQGKLLQCLCEVCENFKFLVEALKKFCVQQKIQLDFRLETGEMLAYMLCSVDGIDCLIGVCNDCGIEQLNFNPILARKEMLVSYEQWGTVEGKKGVMKLADTVEDLCMKVKNNIQMLAIHKADARWQWLQFCNAKDNLEVGDMMMIMDFAENYHTMYQNEVQSAHWSYSMVTIHPFVCYYICPTDNKTVTENVVVISDDPKHDADAVQVFTERVLTYFEEEGITVKNIIQFTDGCGVQYKSRKPFQHISESEKSLTRSYFGSRHGKSPADGIAAVIKKKARSDVKTGTIVIDDARSFFDHMKETKTRKDHSHSHKNSDWKFIYVSSQEIERTEVPSELHTINGTHHLHSVASVEKPGMVKVRLLSCHCHNCREGCDQGPCLGEEVAGPWIPVNLLEKTDLVPQMPKLRERHSIFLMAKKANKPKKVCV